MITQAIKNLVSNAIKYSPERTTVTVSTALEAEAVRLSVEDRGYGIPAEAKDRVWEKFYRVVRKVRKGRRVYGPGLVVCARSDRTSRRDSGSRIGSWARIEI